MDLFKGYFGKISKTIEPDTEYEMRITVKNDFAFYFAPQRLSCAEKVELRKITGELLDRGIIRHSSPPYASQTVLVPKKDGSLRLCVDYRELNKITLKEHFPIPGIDDQLDRLVGKNILV